MYNKVKTKSEIEAMRYGGRVLASVLKKIEQSLNPGITGLQINDIAIKLTVEQGCTPTILGYQGFPAGICVSVNDAVVHGIPDETPLREGDIVGFDFCVSYQGMITDAARTFIVGRKSTREIDGLLKATQRSLDEAIQTVKNGVKVGDISSAAQTVLDKAGYGIVRDLVGHGVGHQMHEEPEVPNYGSKGTGPILKSGMTVAIEPMATLGGWQVVMDPDGWTIRTRDGSLSAHFEDTILVTDDGAEILTRQ